MTEIEQALAELDAAWLDAKNYLQKDKVVPDEVNDRLGRAYMWFLDRDIRVQYDHAHSKHTAEERLPGF